MELRDVEDDDLPVLVDQQLDPEANRMAAFAATDPADRDAFAAKWARIRADETVTMRSIVVDGSVAGSVMLWRDEELDAPEVSYWIGTEFWGRGIATAALTELLRLVEIRPLYGRAAKDNAGSIRVLEKCGFEPHGEERGYANARGEEIAEVVYRLEG
ncbi:MAG: family N-acetyltransferase [Actinomycetia bacterium]|nr:family N-acetyltransferase [Actinomycetes bacterium]